MVLTAARPSEALEARWAEVEFDRRLWTVPPERMKSAKQRVVPLSTAALAVLDRQQKVRTGDAVFPGRSGSPLSYASFATAPAKAGIDACTPHGWRSAFVIGVVTSAMSRVISQKRRWRTASTPPKAPTAG
jgi:integrase